MSKIMIDINEQFHHLSAAPIVEAVIDIRAKSSVKLDETLTREFLVNRLENYSYTNSQMEFSHQVTFGNEDVPQQATISAWKGVQYKSDDGKYIAQFNKDGVVCNRLAPYQDWELFSCESLNHWQLFVELAKPEEISRIGLRIINRIELPPGDGRFENYINPAPQSPRGIDLPFYGFLHQETLAVPGHPYAINLIRTIQPPQNSAEAAIIIDIDVFTLDGVEFEKTRIEGMLEEMRWLKNKTFFGCVTEQALEAFK